MSAYIRTTIYGIFQYYKRITRKQSKINDDSSLLFKKGFIALRFEKAFDIFRHLMQFKAQTETVNFVVDLRIPTFKTSGLLVLKP